MVTRGTARDVVQSITFYDAAEQDADDITDQEIAQLRQTQKHARRAITRPRSSRTDRSKYNTARGSRFEMWNHDEEMAHEVKAHIRDPALLSKDSQWEELIKTGVTHLIIEDDDNKLKVIPSDITKLQTLRSLTLTWCKVKVVPVYIMNMSLKELSVQKCPLKCIDGIGILKTLVTLELTNDGLQTLPDELGELASLVTLNLTGNSIKVLPMSIGNLRNLKTLKLGGNKLKVLPLPLTGLTNLETVDISHNNLQNLPDLIGNLTSLTTLRLTHNNISHLPNSTRQLHNLKHLFLSNNKFQTIPECLSRLQHLLTLHCVSNSIDSMKSGLASVVTLLLDKNELTHLPIEIFDCPRLEQLSLQHNHIPDIPGEIKKLTRLRSLNLSGNDIDELPNEICELNDLRHLVIKENNITELPQHFDALNHLSVIDIEGTRLDYQFSYALKNSGIPGLLEEVRSRRLRSSVDSTDTQSDRGSSIFDEEDESASDSEATKTTHEEASKAAGPGLHDSPLLRDSGYTDDGNGNNTKIRRDVKTVWPQGMEGAQGNALVEAAQSLKQPEVSNVNDSEEAIEMTYKPSSDANGVDRGIVKQASVDKPQPPKKPVLGSGSSMDKVSQRSSQSSTTSENDLAPVKKNRPPVATKPKKTPTP